MASSSDRLTREVLAMSEEIRAMDDEIVVRMIVDLDARVERIEEVLPTLATKDFVETAIREAVTPLADAIKGLPTKADLAEAVAPLATKAELAEAVAPLATKAELAEAVAPLATKAELAEAVAPLATKAELAEAVAPLATKTELAEAVAPLATKTELSEAVAPLATKASTKADLAEAMAETRRHFSVVGEALRAEMRVLAEGLGQLRVDVDDLRRRA